MDIFQKIIVFLYLPVLILVFLIHYMLVGQATYGDGLYYYAYTRSLFKDHDINFHNELGHHYSNSNNNALKEEPLEVQKSIPKTGMVANRYPLGAPLAWLIPFGIADFITHVGNFFHFSLSLSGYGNIYQITIGLTNIFFVITGLYLLYQFLKTLYHPSVAFLTISTIFLGSTLFFYGSIDVVNSHPFSFLLSVLFFTLWARTLKHRSMLQACTLGILVGLLALTRTQDIIFLSIALLPYAVRFFQDYPKTDFTSVKKICLQSLAILFTTAVVCSIQLITWNVIYAVYWVSPYIATPGDQFTFFHPHLVEVFFNTKTGIVLYTPVFLISILGLFLSLQKHRLLKIYSLVLIFLELYIISSWPGWHQGESYGTRMLISSIPFMSIGLGQCVEILIKKFSFFLVTFFCLILISMNMLLILYFLLIAQSPTFDVQNNTQEQIMKRIFNTSE